MTEKYNLVKLEGDGLSTEYLENLLKSCDPPKNTTCIVCEQVYLTIR